MNKLIYFPLVFILLTLNSCSLETTNDVIATNAQGNKITLSTKTMLFGLENPTNISINSSRMFISNQGEAMVGNNSNSFQYQGFLSDGNKKIVTNLAAPRGLALLGNSQFGLLGNQTKLQLINLNTGQIMTSFENKLASFTEGKSLSDNTAIFIDSNSGSLVKAVVTNFNIEVSTLISSFQLNYKKINAITFDPQTNTLYFSAQGALFQTALNATFELVGNIDQWQLALDQNLTILSLASVPNGLLVSNQRSPLLPANILLFNNINRELLYSISGNFSSPEDMFYIANSKSLLIVETDTNRVSAIDISSIIILR